MRNKANFHKKSICATAEIQKMLHLLRVIAKAFATCTWRSRWAFFVLEFVCVGGHEVLLIFMRARVLSSWGPCGSMNHLLFLHVVVAHTCAKAKRRKCCTHKVDVAIFQSVTKSEKQGKTNVNATCSAAKFWSMHPRAAAEVMFSQTQRLATSVVALNQ